LGRWAAGGAITAKSPEEELEEARANTIRAHRESIIWTLQNALEQCGQFQSSMMEIRLMREVEKSKSVLYKTRATMPSNDYSAMNGGSSANRGSKDYRGETSQVQDESSAAIEQQLDPEQLQLFAQENQDMLKQYEDQLDKVRYVTALRCDRGVTNSVHSAAEKSLVEVSELQSTLANNLSIQSAHIEQLVEDSFNTTENVGSGNKELKRATERRSTAQMVFYGTSAFCTLLVLWDLFI
jgi:syntaxin 18